MNHLILRDSMEHPEVFQWLGGISGDVLRGWLRDERLTVPPDLIALWEVTGGGTVFETEEILVPVAGEEKDGLHGEVPSVISRTSSYRWRGLAPEYAVFQEGLFLSAVRQPTGRIVTLDFRTLKEADQFDLLDDWYRRTLRAAYAWRYGLSDLDEQLGEGDTSSGK